jgi:hypothetical protein
MRIWRQRLSAEVHATFKLPCGLRQSQSYFTTGGLPPISLSWRQAPWDSRPAIFFQLNTCGHSPHVTSSLTRGWVCHLQPLLALASAVILGYESRGPHNHNFTASGSRLPRPWGQGPRIYIPQEQGGPVIPPGTGFPFRRSYDSQGYGGGIRTRLHKGLGAMWLP